VCLTLSIMKGFFKPAQFVIDWPLDSKW
jgi:hypothetical protein